MISLRVRQVPYKSYRAVLDLPPGGRFSRPSLSHVAAETAQLTATVLRSLAWYPHCRAFAPCLAANWTVFQSPASRVQRARPSACAASEFVDNMTQDTSKQPAQDSMEGCVQNTNPLGIGSLGWYCGESGTCLRQTALAMDRGAKDSRWMFAKNRWIAPRSVAIEFARFERLLDRGSHHG